MTISGSLVAGLSDGMIYIALPTAAIVYLFLIIGKLIAGPRGLAVAAAVIQFFAGLPVLYVVIVMVWAGVKSGFAYPRYGDEFLGFYLLSCSLVCLVLTRLTVRFTFRHKRG